MDVAQSTETVSKAGRKKKPKQRKPVREDTGELDYELKKRAPPRQVDTDKDNIYVSKQSNFQALLTKCMNKLATPDSEIVIHGLGAAICKSINLALRVKEHFQSHCEIDATTSTVTIVDDLEPLNEELEFDTQTRINSAIQIRIFRQ